MSRADFPPPPFTWRSHRSERWTWRSIGVLLAITAGAGFYAGRLSVAEPILSEQPAGTKPERTAASGDNGAQAQRQAAVQPNASTAPARATASAEVKTEARDGTSEAQTAAQAQAQSPQTSAESTRTASRQPAVLINPKTADKASSATAPKQSAPAAGTEAVANANARTDAHKAADDSSPTAAPAKRQAKLRSPAPSNLNAPPARSGTVIVRRDDAYVPPRIPQAAYGDPRGRYDNVDGDDDPARFDQRYPDRRYADDAPPPRMYEDYGYRRETLRPYQDPRNFRDYRRFDGYDSPYEVERPLLRPMNGVRID